VSDGAQPTRRLIVNADDFGQSPGINRGVAIASEQGIVTSASLMVRWPAAAAEAAAIARRLPRLSVGLHFDLGEWIYGAGEWRPLYEVVPVDDESAVRNEARAQLDRFRELVGADPTHVDSHQHVHRHEPVTGVLEELAAELDVPLRDRTPLVRYSGDFYGQSGRGELLPDAITTASLLEILRQLPAGVTELGCHPADAADVTSPYGAERLTELATLCDPRVKLAVADLGIRLLSFGDPDVRGENGRYLP
jgi:predicted glycoside hydrolase/deacetylase ChbG (UPF0249 family)